MKPGTLLAVILMTLVAFAHLLRLVTGAEVVVAGFAVPQWVSIGGTLVPALIAWLLWKESR